MNLNDHHIILVNTSAGKDSQTALDVVCRMAEAQGFDRTNLHAVHADLGRVEWRGTKELAAEQVSHYGGVRFHVVKRQQNDLLGHVEQRGKWMGAGPRYCTSDHKRGPVLVLITRLVDEYRRKHFNVGPNDKRMANGQPVPAVKVLNVMGIRAAESDKRKAMPPVERNPRSNGKREITNWLPIHAWSEAQVWENIRRTGVRSHWAYGLGMPRLSCCFCIFGDRDALLIAGEHNPELLAEYVRVEMKIKHTFKPKLALISIQTALANGERGNANAITWAQCA